MPLSSFVTFLLIKLIARRKSKGEKIHPCLIPDVIKKTICQLAIMLNCTFKSVVHFFEDFDDSDVNPIIFKDVPKRLAMYTFKSLFKVKVINIK